MVLTLSIYIMVTKWISEYRRVEMRARKEADQKSEFFLNESIMNIETVKCFTSEQIEKKRYFNLVDKVKQCQLTLQYSLVNLNLSQAAIFTTGLAFNLIMSAWGVF